jgi:hypothetical protein
MDQEKKESTANRKGLDSKAPEDDTREDLVVEAGWCCSFGNVDMAKGYNYVSYWSLLDFMCFAVM